MINWDLTIAIHWPHDRCALGWEYIAPDKTFQYATIKLYLIFVTFILDY